MSSGGDVRPQSVGSPPSKAEAPSSSSPGLSPAVAPAPGGTARPSRTQAQGVQLLSLGLRSAKVAALLVTVWLIGYLRLSVTWALLVVIGYVVGEELTKNRLGKKRYAGQAEHDEQTAVLARVDELPSWVIDYLCNVKIGLLVVSVVPWQLIITLF